MTSVPPAADSPPPRVNWAGLAVLGTILFAMALIGAIYFRWLMLDEPRSFVEVVADEAANGTVIRIETIGPGSTGNLKATLNPADNYSARFFLRPGTYAFAAIPPGQEPYQFRFVVDNNPPMRVDLRGRLAAATQPTSR